MNKMAKKISKQEEDHSYFVSVKSPLEFRRQVLEASKKTIYCLQNYQQILLIREKKIKEMSALKHSIKELMFLNRKFNDKLPKYDKELLHDVKKISKETESAFKEYRAIERKAPKVEKPKLNKEKTDLERLEDALASIEGKLRTLK
jgi:hypothetical protein